VPGIPSRPLGTLEVYEVSAEDGSEINKQVVRIVFGRALQNPYHGFAVHRVRQGETLSSIAEQWYGDAGRFRDIYDANRNQLNDPDVIFPGQQLRIPQ
jgi:nucleoid-associated protein YgaU